MTTTKTSSFGNETCSRTNTSPGSQGIPTGLGPVDVSVTKTSNGHEPSVTKSGSSDTKTKGVSRASNVDTSAKVPRSHAYQKGDNPRSVGFLNEMCHSKVVSQSRQNKGVVTGEKGKSAGFDVVAEIARLKSHVGHLEAPKPAICHHGLPVDELIDWWGELARKARQQVEMKEYNNQIVKCKQRESTAILMVSLASFPGAPDDTNPKYVEWKTRTIQFALKKYGDKIIGIYEHVDEPHGHLHIVVANGGKPVKLLMVGEKAFADTLAVGGTRKEAGEAKNAANKALLDLYHDEVGKPMGMLRASANPERRISWKAAKARQIRKAEEFQEGERHRLDTVKAAQEAEQQLLDKQRGDLISKEFKNSTEMLAKQMSFEDRARRMDALEEKRREESQQINDEIKAFQAKLLREKAELDQKIKENKEFFAQMMEISKDLEIEKQADFRSIVTAAYAKLKLK